MGVEEGSAEDTGATSNCSDQEDDDVEDTGAKPTSNGAEKDKPSDLEAKIIRQIEYYFGDINLVTDKFMRQQIKLDDGWIPLETMVKFNRLKILATEPDVIVSALKKSTNNLIEVSEDGEKLRRNPQKPMPEEGATPFEEIKARSVYLKGFPQDSTLDQLMEFFKDKGDILKIHMRKKYNSKNFKGSIFATFGSKEEAEKFMEIGVIKFRNRELLKELSVNYHARKAKELQKRKEDKDKKLQDRKQKAEDNADKDEAEKDSKDENEEEVNDSIIDVKGSVLKLSGFAPKTCWEDIREVFQTYGEIAYVDFSRGQEEGYVRFEKEGNAQKALDEAQTKGSDPKTVNIVEKEIEMHVIEGDDEIQYWKKLKQRKDNLRKRSRNFRGRGGWGNRGRGGGGYQRKRRGNDRGDSSEPFKKAARNE